MQEESIFKVLPIEIISIIAEYFDGITSIRFGAVCAQAKVCASGSFNILPMFEGFN
jgi:hypothetical protein